MQGVTIPNGKKQLVVHVLLIISLLLNIGLLVFAFYQKPQPLVSITGTYIAGAEVSPDCNYLVLQADGSYVLYKQFELLEEGCYMPEAANIYALTAQDGAARSVIYEDGADTLYVTGLDNSIVVFSKISQMPTFINLPKYGNQPS